MPPRHRSRKSPGAQPLTGQRDQYLALMVGQGAADAAGLLSLSLHWPGGKQSPNFASKRSAFSCDQPGCALPTTFQPPAQGGLPGARRALPSTVSTSTSVTPGARSPTTVTDLPTYALSGCLSP